MSDIAAEVNRMKVRIRDIAQRAGVSPATVSNALNARQGVSDEIRRHIIRLASDMGYVTDNRSDKTVKPYIRLVMFRRYGLVVTDTQFFVELIEGVERGCREEGKELVVTNIHIGKDPDYLDVVRSICADQCAGVLLLGTEMEAQDLELFGKCESPLLLLDNLFRHEKVHSIAMDNYDAGFQAVQALKQAGHRRIGHITSNIDISNMRYRRKGYEAAMIFHKLPLDEMCIWEVTPTIEGACQDIKALLKNKRPLPTAFFVGNDIMAIGCLQALQEYNVRVPQDISIVGMDDLNLCQISTPSLSTVRVQRLELGRTAVHTLLYQIYAMQSCHLKIEMSVDFVKRDSVRRLDT